MFTITKKKAKCLGAYENNGTLYKMIRKFSTSTVESRMADCQNIKKKFKLATLYDSAALTKCTVFERIESRILKRYCTFMFMAASSTKIKT